MFENIERDADERGQVGIGTLIVFIALVLVAAIAAGVLINTAGFLQNQAESTGQESTNQVSNSVQIQSVTGIDSSTTDGDIEQLEVAVTLSPGADPVDLEDATFEYLADSSTTFSGTDGEITGYNQIAGSGSDASLLDESEDQTVATISLDSGDMPSSNNLDAGDSAELSITTQSGATTTEAIEIPDPDGLSSGDSTDEAIKL